MNIFRKYQKALSKLTVIQIQSLTDEEIRNFAIEHPGHPGQLGFMFSPEDFVSESQMAEVSHAYMARLNQASNL